jgi:hypothetical protein
MPGKSFSSGGLSGGVESFVDSMHGTSGGLRCWLWPLLTFSVFTMLTRAFFYSSWQAIELVLQTTMHLVSRFEAH